MYSFVGYLFLLSVLCRGFFRVEGQSQSWNTKHAEAQDQDGGGERQHWASGKAKNGGQQFMSMSSLYDKMENLFDVDSLFVGDSAAPITGSFGTASPRPVPDAAKELQIEKAVDDIDVNKHQTWATAVIDNVFGGLPDLGLGVSYPVVLPMIVPVRFLSDKDIDISIEQIYSPPPTEEGSINDGGSKLHQNTEKLHIHLGPKGSAIPDANIKYEQDAIYYGDEGLVFTGKLKLKRKTLCKILCLRGEDNVPACCDCSGGSRRRGASSQRAEKNIQGERALFNINNNVNWFSESRECSFLDSSYVSGADVTDADCTYCKCFDGEIACFVRKTCTSLQEEQQKFEAELDEVRKLVIEKGSSDEVSEKFRKLKLELVELQKKTKQENDEITENLKRIFEEAQQGAPSQMKHVFLLRYQQQDEQAKQLNYWKNELLQSIINDIKSTL